MKLLYYIPAFGKNNLDVKYNILVHNLNYIYDNIKESFDISINFYTYCDEIKKNLRLLKFINNLYVYEKEGILTELFLTNPNNEKNSLYDYILFVLDDVKLIDINFKKMIKIKKKHKIEFLSIKILKSTHKFMNSYDCLTINNFLEIYLLLLTPSDFIKFCSINTIENKWMWGIDLLFGYYNIKAAVLHIYTAEHVLPSNSNRNEAITLMNNYFKTYTKYKSMRDVFKKFKPIKEKIKL